MKLSPLTLKGCNNVIVECAKKLGGGFILAVIAVSLAAFVLADIGLEYQPDDSRTYIFNNGSIKQDWFYNGTCLNTLSNVGFNDTWWENILYGFSYGDTREDVLDNYIEFSPNECNRIDQNNSNFVNLTAWKDKTFSTKTVRLAKNAYLEENDDYMKETYHLKAFDDINQNVWFVLHRSNINIGGDEANDELILVRNDGTLRTVSLVNHSGKTFINGSNYKKGFFLKDSNKTSRVAFSFKIPASKWHLAIWNGDVYTLFKGGTFSAGDVKSLETFWVDDQPEGEPCFCVGGTAETVSISIPDNSEYVGFSNDMKCKVDYTSGFCLDCYLDWEVDNPSWTDIDATSTPLECVSPPCSVDASDNVWYSERVECNEEATPNIEVRCYHNRAGTNADSVFVCLDNKAPTVNFTRLTPQNDSYVYPANFTIEADVNNSLFLNNSFFNFNGSIFPVYNSSLYWWFNFDNISGLGEDDGRVKSIDKNKITGTLRNGATTEYYTGDSGNKYLSCDGNNDFVNLSLMTVKDDTWSITLWTRYDNTAYTNGDRVIETGWASDRAFILYQFLSVNPAFGKSYIFSVRNASNKGITLYAGNLTNSFGANDYWHFLSVVNYGGYIEFTHDVYYHIEPVVSWWNASCSNCYLNDQVAPVICAKWTGGANYLKGDIDDLRIYNRSLSRDELSFIYNMSFRAVTDRDYEFKYNVSGLLNGTYNIRLNVSDSLDRRDYDVRDVNIGIAPLIFADVEADVLSIVIKGYHHLKIKKKEQIWLPLTKVFWYGIL